MNELQTAPTVSTRMVVLLETVTVFLWFLLDGFWLMEWKLATYICSGVCMVTCLLIFTVLERKPVVLWMAGADTAWLCTNILWAMGDLGHQPNLLLSAKVSAFVGLVLFAVAILISKAHKEFTELVLRRMRLLQILSGRLNQ